MGRVKSSSRSWLVELLEKAAQRQCRRSIPSLSADGLRPSTQKGIADAHSRAQADGFSRVHHREIEALSAGLESAPWERMAVQVQGW